MVFMLKTYICFTFLFFFAQRSRNQRGRSRWDYHDHNAPAKSEGCSQSYVDVFTIHVCEIYIFTWIILHVSYIYNIIFHISSLELLCVYTWYIYIYMYHCNRVCVVILQLRSASQPMPKRVPNHRLSHRSTADGAVGAMGLASSESGITVIQIPS